MYRPPQPRMLNNIPRNYLQPNFQWPNPRAFNRRCYSFNPRPPISSDGSGDYWCETCDRGFATLNLLEHHKQQHQKCNIDGCQFVAHPKVITKHIQMQHSSGLYKKIAKLDKPEEIKKWREERKKNFPTKSNIEKKAKELSEKIKRGEKMGLKYHDRGIRRDHNDRKLKPGIKRKYENHNYQNKNFRGENTIPSSSQTKKKVNSNHLPPKKITKMIVPLDEKRKLKPFTGIQNIVVNDKDEEEIELSNDNIMIEDDDDNESGSICNIKEPSNVEDFSMCSSLTSLICNYGSSDEDEIDTSVNNNTAISVIAQLTKHEEITHKNIEGNLEIVNKQNNEPPQNEESQKKTLREISTTINDTVDTNIEDDSGPEEVKIIKENKDKINHTENKADVRNVQIKSKDRIKLGHKNNTYPRFKSKLPSTLLQKLLCKEIRHERNIILQCIRYITKNNYFDKKS